VDKDGYYYIVGRKKEMIIVGGFNIYPQEVENILYDHPAVKEVAVVGIPHEHSGERVKAYSCVKRGGKS
jgi:long-chain acyl-CoA synthetase